MPVLTMLKRLLTVLKLSPRLPFTRYLFTFLTITTLVGVTTIRTRHPAAITVVEVKVAELEVSTERRVNRRQPEDRGHTCYGAFRVLVPMSEPAPPTGPR
jgi:hypothetical protein